jgi:hypothetical protein
MGATPVTVTIQTNQGVAQSLISRPGSEKFTSAAAARNEADKLACEAWNKHFFHRYSANRPSRSPWTLMVTIPETSTKNGQNRITLAGWTLSPKTKSMGFCESRRRNSMTPLVY